ncbi:unnamed protein product [Ambrosiozyma monospora]|uniref:Unnamed protein product n=1 Tax=Ambrosiozyma monospora TaxID=43982 RepID=A0ACB5U9C0_AMBMO|nr:unnamed protein product [Ambrosiozyma monospora]
MKQKSHSSAGLNSYYGTTGSGGNDIAGAGNMRVIPSFASLDSFYDDSYAYGGSSAYATVPFTGFSGQPSVNSYNHSQMGRTASISSGGTGPGTSTGRAGSGGSGHGAGNGTAGGAGGYSSRQGSTGGISFSVAPHGQPHFPYANSRSGSRPNSLKSPIIQPAVDRYPSLSLSSSIESTHSGSGSALSNAMKLKRGNLLQPLTAFHGIW